MFENKKQRVVSVSIFAKRMLVFIGLAILLICIALAIGIAGYHWVAGFDWIDSLLNASMILGGMGPVNPLPDVTAKVFASFYALFSGLVFIAVMGIVLTPVVHRLLHKFHVED
ncbi:MAG: hypothetical protein HQL17_05550 [Candidatus Omnitrophica bacterium]|nr:hypothetical protein [Candidatus Omnitrophota bacterium]